MKGIAVWTRVAAAASMLFSLAAGAVTISGSVTTTSGGFAQINFTCDGSPTCTGTYTATLQDHSCSAPASSSGGVTLTGMNPAQAGFSGNITLTGFTYFLSNCATATTTLSGTYTATSDGTTGSLNLQVSTPDGPATLQGGFSVGAPSTVRISGILSDSDPDGFMRISFSCAGMPTCIGTFNIFEKDHGCSNTFSFNGSFVINGLDVSHPGSFSGTAIHYGDSSSTVSQGGTCLYGIRDNHAHSTPYTATWDGTTGTMTLNGQDSDGGTFQIGGTFTAAGIAPSPTFPMTVTSNITPTTANASAQVQPRSQDAGTTQSIFVFAYAPQSLVSASGKRLPWTGEVAARALDGPDPCVLAQVNAGGQLTGATASTMQAYTTGVLTSQGQSVSILNNVSTPNVAGATMYVGYGASSATMFSNGTYQGAVNIPGAAQCTTNLATAAAPSSPGALTGLFWNPSESGWGIHFTQRGTNLFAAWYTYDTAGKPKWYVSTCAGISGQSGICNGTLYEVTGPNFFGGAFNPSLVNATAAGSLQVNFSNANAASMTYTGVAGQTRTVSLTRQPLATGTASPAVDFSDIWWGGNNESGWGMAMAQQYGTNFLAWYVYDSSGKPTWLVATCTMSGTSCNGTLYRTTGPNFGPTFNPAAVQATQAGTIGVNFTDANNAIINYVVDGASATKSIRRQLF